MSRSKIWTERQRDQLKARRADEQAAAHAATARRRSLLRAAAVTVTVTAVFTVAGIFSTTSHAPEMLAFSAASGLLVSAAWLVYRWLRPRLGAKTSVLTISLAGAVAFLSLAAASPQCPDSSGTGRCSSAELADWGTVGLLLPLVAAVTVGTVMLLARTAAFLVRTTYRLLTGQATLRDLIPRRHRLAGTAGQNARPVSSVPSNAASKAASKGPSGRAVRVRRPRR